MHTYTMVNSAWWVVHFRRKTIRGAGESYAEDKMIMMRDFDTEAEAARYCNYLNGGLGMRFTPQAEYGDGNQDRRTGTAPARDARGAVQGEQQPTEGQAND